MVRETTDGVKVFSKDIPNKLLYMQYTKTLEILQ